MGDDVGERVSDRAKDAGCDTDRSPRLTVYHDGACPVCRREIAYYRRREGADHIDWVDADAAKDDALGPGLDRAAALGRFHVRDADGTLYSGSLAFAALWRTLPGFRSLGRVLGAPGISWLADRAYTAFLKVRPAVQRFAAKSEG